MTSPSHPHVTNNTSLSRFELKADGETAIAVYRLADGVMNFTHTEVPPHLRERGIGSALVRGALDAARADGLKVRPLCSFVRAFLAQHPEYQDLVA